MSHTNLRRALWICDYFPRPHDTASGTWALENTVALQTAGLPTVALAPTPWIPRPLAVTSELRDWSRVPRFVEMRGVPVYYPACPHYPRAWVNNSVYPRLPFLDSALVWPWCKTAVEKMMREHPFDVVHTNFLFPGGYLGMKIKEQFGTPYIVHERSIQRMAAARKHPGRGRLYRRILRNSDLVVTENSKMAAQLREMDPGVPEVKVIVQPGTHPEKVAEQVRERPVEYSDKLVVLSVGALSTRKGHSILIEAIAKLVPEFPSLICQIIGGGPERQNLEALIDRLGVGDHVELLGKQPHADVLGNMSWCDVFVLASWGEASGTVYGEAMQFGKPAIACADEGISEVLEDGKHGRLVPARDVPALIEALRWLLEDAQRRNMIGEQARQLANEKLSYSAVAHELIEIYEALADAARRRSNSSEQLSKSTEKSSGRTDNPDSDR